jgi:hypothetical protein
MKATVNDEMNIVAFSCLQVALKRIDNPTIGTVNAHTFVELFERDRLLGRNKFEGATGPFNS